MPLPVTKAELNRLGDRLRDSPSPSDSDRKLLAVVLAAYRENLTQAETHLRDLGYAPTTRVKTTPTMTDKLRRTHGMELARMQDLAGARIVVADIAAQDEAAGKISARYQQLQCPCRLVDRRADPRYGYRAVHLIVHIDLMPLEIQIRTQMQDTWANIVERLADRWGRGIRYGQDPEDPEEGVPGRTRLAALRREVVTSLMEVSDQAAPMEHSMAQAQAAVAILDKMTNSLIEVQPAQFAQFASRDAQARLRDGVGRVLEDLRMLPEQDIREILDQEQNLTYDQATRLLEVARRSVHSRIREIDEALQYTAQTLRESIQKIGKAERW
jgi:ppGpp synthetase/RelA/SpoT-type nucleotidyltranferase